MKSGIIEVNVRLYLEVDVDKKEAQKIVDDMEHGFEHALIADTSIYNHEQVDTSRRGTKKMTPSELKYQVEQSGTNPYFFTRKTMKFFGDTMRNYGVRCGGTTETEWDKNGKHMKGKTRTIEIWELYRKRSVKHGLNSSTYFDKETFERVFI